MIGIPPRTQRAYDELLQRGSQENYAITDLPYIPENVQDFAWQHGNSTLRFVDKLGLRGGSPGQAYIARQLPSTREVIHERALKGRQPKYNDCINLVNKLARGNDADDVVAYHESPEEAAEAFNRDPSVRHYYPDEAATLDDSDDEAPSGRVRLWNTISP